ncbi:MAG: hypothetical protein SFW64_06865 [Alphaproteobacteria bacterium]|nr:hypothetical protein [Alphaproteobacteria bacterium]
MRPTKPSSTENPFLADLDQMTPQELADYFYALAEEIIASPEEYKIKMQLAQLDISELDNIDLNTAAGRKKLAKLFRMLAEQALRGKDVYQATVVDKSKNTTRGR